MHIFVSEIWKTEGAGKEDPKFFSENQALMDETNFSTKDMGIKKNKYNDRLKVFDPAIPTFFAQLPQKLRNCVQSHIKRSAKEYYEGLNSLSSNLRKETTTSSTWEVDLQKQLQAWQENPIWTDQPADIKVTIPKGSLCNLNVNVNIGLPPDAVFNIVTDPDNKRVFKNIQEVKSRRVLLDEGSRQVVETEQAALWKFLWWSGTISVHVLVDQNRQDHTMKFKQVKTGFMKRFEGCWRVEPIFVDESLCYPLQPKTWGEYCSCTKGKGRVASKVSLDQLVHPSIVPPPPISWYLRGITTKTTEMIINDLQEEASRIRGNSDFASDTAIEEFQEYEGTEFEREVDELRDIKTRWALRRRNARQCSKR